MKDLLLATTNAGKIKEISEILADVPLRLLTPADFGLDLVVSENSGSYFGNARLKASQYAAAAGIPALADDSGLEVEALGGDPGVHSRRFSPTPSATDRDRCQYLLEKLKNIPRPWKARFVCAVVVRSPSEELLNGWGECPGEIIPDFRGDNGFGYDPIFLVGGVNKTMAELTDIEKNALSHRARALQAALPALYAFAQA
ncbi:MAG: RdgB/HAM1 family non-canonical purine NTP pyrophosphatase [Chloroflexi bacterium]|jgi:XTP/dITP diphosphohydrolase|nr:RdgB/HAM1 family non-canonical purine NTP pyrophosphatase [Anaerolineaceae bacterium]NLI44144.1 RdgB/HAM1 family non-canonical purine NTP pyrophosphatase [Chloroflexota bacterium]HOE34616.1 RdgB/HAM1 family non-canonical purine NTP pyrophosphatase [Anaerolineaceae bacterium]HOT24860.1 RdgB/HAM1 family non-canonical purine NTP pyrophosphatase [Anaerolineaceae bacterium]HQH57629.1 RdgB/HAM1 family non-canonical purine NTP pyrophosphatase [Anaerolineaceae bacterium]